MSKILAILRRDIRWGRIAGVALLAAFISAAISMPGAMSLVPLLVFSIGGIFIEQIAPNRPFWNSLFYGLFGVLFLTILSILAILGRYEPFPPLADMGMNILYLGGVIMVQALVGTWLGVSLRRMRRVSGEQPVGRKESTPARPDQSVRPPQKPARGQTRSKGEPRRR